MKRLSILFLALILTTACSFTGTQTPPPTSTEPAPVPETLSPTESATTLLYISGTSHIETNRQTWPNVDEFLTFLQQVTDLGMRWSIGADIGWLEGEPRAAELIQKSEALGVQWDIHTHNMNDRGKAAHLLIQYGGHPTSVYSGFKYEELDMFTSDASYQGTTWVPQVLWGAVACPGHRPGCDVDHVGLWSPGSGSTYFTHDPNSSLIHVGGGDHDLATGRELALSIANGENSNPIISFTVMVAPSTLQVASTGDGIDGLIAFVNEMNAYSFVRWATIEETAHAWVAAGSIPSAIEMK